MKIIVVGCGKVGSALARQLSEEGQEVVKELLDTLREWQDKALKGVSEHDKKVFIKVLDMIEIKAAELDQQ